MALKQEFLGQAFHLTRRNEMETKVIEKEVKGKIPEVGQPWIFALFYVISKDFVFFQKV